MNYFPACSLLWITAINESYFCSTHQYSVLSVFWAFAIPTEVYCYLIISTSSCLIIYSLSTVHLLICLLYTFTYLFVWGPHAVVLWGYSWFGAPGLFLVVLSSPAGKVCAPIFWAISPGIYLPNFLKQDSIVQGGWSCHLLTLPFSNYVTHHTFLFLYLWKGMIIVIASSLQKSVLRFELINIQQWFRTVLDTKHALISFQFAFQIDKEETLPKIRPIANTPSRLTSGKFLAAFESIIWGDKILTSF